MSTVVVATRVSSAHAESLREIARLRRTTISDVVSRIITENVEPSSDDPAPGNEPMAAAA